MSAILFLSHTLPKAKTLFHFLRIFFVLKLDLKLDLELGLALMYGLRSRAKRGLTNLSAPPPRPRG